MVWCGVVMNGGGCVCVGWVRWGRTGQGGGVSGRGRGIERMRDEYGLWEFGRLIH